MSSRTPSPTTSPSRGKRQLCAASDQTFLFRRSNKNTPKIRSRQSLVKLNNKRLIFKFEEGVKEDPAMTLNSKKCSKMSPDKLEIETDQVAFESFRIRKMSKK